MKNLILLLLFISISLVSLSIGVLDVNIYDMSDKSLWILAISRFPRYISTVIAGAGLAISGLIMQQLSHNKFASPSTTGTMESACLGILIGMIYFSSYPVIVKIMIGFIFAITGTWIFLTLLDKIKIKNAIFIPLLGIMFGKVVMSVVDFFAYKYDVTQSVSSWLYGNFSVVLQGRYELLYLGIPLTILAYAYATSFTISGFGNEFATNLGLNYKKIKYIGLSIVSLISASVVIIVGIIPFVGLIIPNIVSILCGDNTKKNLPIIALLGASFVLVCDIFSRLIIYPYEISIGLIVSIIGSVLFLCFIARRRFND